MNNMKYINETGALEELTQEDLLFLEKNGRKIGGKLCSALRHNPERLELHMEPIGAWVKVEELIEQFNSHNHKKGMYLNMPRLMEIVRTDNKQRYGLRSKDNELYIRCNQGHSIPWVEMEYKEEMPPKFLYHGTSEGFLDDIMRSGLKPMKRQKVHLSMDEATATQVGNRKRSHGSLVILAIEALERYEDGGVFYLSENNVWLADEIHPQYIRIVFPPQNLS